MANTKRNKHQKSKKKRKTMKRKTMKRKTMKRKGGRLANSINENGKPLKIK